MTGEIAALSAALLWALASILFADIGKHVRAVNLNLIKGLLACILMLGFLGCGSLLGLSKFDLGTISRISGEGYVLLILSGIIGIGIGDTAYFACLRRIGPQKGLMLESTAPIIAAFLALFLFQEQLSILAWTGIVLTTGGVVIVVKWSQTSLGYTTTMAGLLFGLLAAFCQAMGIVLSRKALLAAAVEPLTSGLIRLSAAVAVMAFWLLLRRLRRTRGEGRQSMSEAMACILKHNLLVRVLGAVTLGTFLAIWLMQTSVKFTSAGITQTLLATCPLFGMIIGVFQGYRQIPLVWGGLLLGIAGIGLLFLP